MSRLPIIIRWREGRLAALPILLLMVAACRSDGGSSPNWRGAALDAAATIDASWLQERIAALSDDNMEGRDNLSLGGQRAREWLKSQMEAIGLEPFGRSGWEQPFPEGINLVGRLEGKDEALKNEYVVVSGHYDHLGIVGAPHSQCRALDDDPDTICNGAADNAAGSIATLAIAKALVESKVGVRRSVLFLLWDAEEDGLLGSKYFVSQDPIVPLDSIVAMYTVDNVGAMVIPGVMSSFALSVETSDRLRELVKINNEALNYENYPVSAFFAGDTSGGRSDHVAFRDSGIPVIFFGSGSPPQYHTPEDEVGIINFEKLTLITRHALLMTADVANDADRPDFVADPRPSLDDATALVALGEIVLADPGALGLDDPELIGVLQGFMDQLNEYLANPPQTDAEWQAYQQYVRSIIVVVYTFISG